MAYIGRNLWPIKSYFKYSFILTHYFKMSALLLVSIVIFSTCKKEVAIVDSPKEDPCPLGSYTGITISYSNTRADVDRIGASNIHTWIHWDFIQEEIFDPNLKVSDVTEEMIEEFISGSPQGVDWTLTDDYFQEFEGLNNVVGIGSGWLTDMPLYQGKKITPDDIGRENYLGLVYLYTRSCVRRYASNVIGWQIENEPNVSNESVLVGIRKGAAWQDDAFVTQVIQTLENAVRAEDPDTWITINFHTDLHYVEDIQKWLPYIDIVGIDAYPNFFNGEPQRADLVIERLVKAKTIANGKSVILMETGYSSFPESAGFSEENQAAYIDGVFSKLDEIGVCGGFYFKLSSSENINSSNTIDHMGLVRLDNSVKLGWQAFEKYID